MADKILLLGAERASGLRLARILIQMGLRPVVDDWTTFSPRGYSRFGRPGMAVVNCDHPLAGPFGEFSALIRKYWGEAFPIVAVTKNRKVAHIETLLDAGADDCFPPDAPEALVERKIAARLSGGRFPGERPAPAANELTVEVPGSLLGLFPRNENENGNLVPLGEMVSVHSGAAPRSSWSRRTAPPDESWLKVVTGDCLDKFHISRPDTYLFWSKLHLFRLPPPEEYSVPEKVIVSRVGPPLVAAVDKQRLPVGGDAYSVVPKEGIGAGFVCCLLNSRLLDFYFNRLTDVSGGRLRPDDIRSVPAPRPGAAANREFDRFATLLAHFGPNPESWIDRQSRSDVREQMDEAVFALYGVPEAARNELAELHF